MNVPVKMIRLPTIQLIKRRGLKTSATYLAESKSLQNFNPNRYSVPLRAPTMDDLMEPYGSWKIAYEAERKRGNKMLILGFLCLSTTLTIFYQSGVADGIWMPNLDNIMEDTPPFDFGDKSDRVTV